MKLGKLLAAGKSIMNGRADVSYRSSKQIYLPKFGTPKNPFKPESSAHTESSPQVGGTDESRPRPVRLADDAATSVSAAFNGESQLPARPQTESSAKSRDNSPGHAMSLDKPLPCQAPRIEPTSSVPVGTGASHLAPSFTSSIQQKRGKDWNKFNPLSILRAALPAGKTGRQENAAKGPRGTVTQTELSLDSVKVVHNDLSDVDVEVVPIKSRATVPDLPAPKKSWEFVGERLFGVEAT
jgi:hypothetical protein